MNKSFIIGVMGGGNASPKDTNAAYRLGCLIAEQGWILLNGGRNAGIMDASAKGAKDHGGLTVGILPDDNPGRASEHIDIPVITGMGSARNCINVLTSHIVVACPGGAGTLSEIALALKFNKVVILMGFDVGKLFESYIRPNIEPNIRPNIKQGTLVYTKTPEEVIAYCKKLYIQREGALRNFDVV